MPPRALRRTWPPDGYVVSAQNGLNERIIAEIVGGERTIGCFVNFGADYMEPGVVHVRRARRRGRRRDRRARKRRASRSCTRCCALFEPDAELTENIWGYLWGKLIYGAMLFATALTNELDRRLARRPALPARCAPRSAREVVAVARRKGQARGLQRLRPACLPPGVRERRSRAPSTSMVAFNRRSAKTQAASGATSPSASGGPRSTRSSAPIVEIGRGTASRRP